MSVRLSKAEEVPRYLDIYRPHNQSDDTRTITGTSRNPDPAKWLIITTRSERGNLFKVKRLVNQKIGNVKRPEISRYGRSSFLVNTKTDEQAVMLLNLKLEPEEIIKEVKLHYNFSYAKGVVFNEDIYELDEEEILEMCPEVVWKVFKVPRSSMLILTFVNSFLPPEIVLDSEIIKVRPYRPRVLQCFNCFGFGHSSRVCTRGKICESCAQPEHEECSRPVVCVNCKGDHRARDKQCTVFKKEQEALLKSVAEHISVGHAKKLLAKRMYSDAVKMQNSNSVSLSTDIDTSRASSGGAPRASSGGASRASSGGASRASSGGASWASSGGASRASSGGASRASVGAPRRFSDGAPKVPSAGTISSSLEALQASKVPQSSSDDTEIQSEPRNLACPGARSGCMNDLDDFSLSGSLPDIHKLPSQIVSSPLVVVHRSNDDEEMEALAVRPKRARSPSSPHSRSRSHDRITKNKTERASESPSSKKSSIRSRSNSKDKSVSNKVSLSRSQIPKPIDPNKKIPKSK